MLKGITNEIEKINIGNFSFLSRKDTLDYWVIDEVVNPSMYLRPLEINGDDVVLDIGANIGIFSVVAGKRAKKVFSYEPDNENFNVAKGNLKENNIKNCEIFELGVSGEKCEKTLWLNTKKNRGNHSMQFFNGREALIVKCVGINEVLKLSNPTKIKIDCEGEEYEILKSVKKWGKVERIVMEWHRKILKDESNTLFNEIIEKMEKDFEFIGKRDAKGWTQKLLFIRKKYV